MSSCVCCRGPLGWLVPSEIQPLETRAAGTAVNTFTNMIMTFVIGQCFLSMLCAMKFGVSGTIGFCALERSLCVEKLTQLLQLAA